MKAFGLPRSGGMGAFLKGRRLCGVGNVPELGVRPL